MTFFLGSRSRSELVRVNHLLARTAEDAILLTPIDFGVISGLRDDDEQLKLYRGNHSKLNGIPKGKRVGNITGTGVSMHQLRLAIDIAAFIQNAEGKSSVTWEVKYYLPIAEAFGNAARRKGLEMVWGGCWDKPLTEIKDFRLEMNRYKRLCLARGKKPFIDAGHFQLERRYQK